MKREDALAAFALRYDGATWKQIGQKTGMHPNTARQFLASVLRGDNRKPFASRWRLMDLIQDKYGGSVCAFAKACGVSHETIYRLLRGGGKYRPNVRTADAIANACGLTPEEIFGEIY